MSPGGVTLPPKQLAKGSDWQSRRVRKTDVLERVPFQGPFQSTPTSPSSFRNQPWRAQEGNEGPKTDSARDAKITIAAGVGAKMPAAEAASVQEPTVKDLFTTQQTCAHGRPSPSPPAPLPPARAPPPGRGLWMFRSTPRRRILGPARPPRASPPPRPLRISGAPPGPARGRPAAPRPPSVAVRGLPLAKHEEEEKGHLSISRAIPADGPGDRGGSPSTSPSSSSTSSPFPAHPSTTTGT